MVDSEELAKRTRTPGVRYPGASLATVIDLLKILDAAGGESSIGRVAAKLEMAEGGATFKRVLISARSYELAEWSDSDQSVIGMTAAGHKALAGDLTVLRRALILPPTFRAIARKFKGRTLPADGLAESFKLIGVAPAGAQLAADNFEASAVVAEVLSAEGGKKILTHELPFDEVDAESDREETDEGRTAPRRLVDPKAKKSGAGTPRVRPSSPTPVKTSVPTLVQGAPTHVGMDLRLDVSGWSVDKVVELVRRLREEGLH